MRTLTEEELAKLPEFYLRKYQHWLTAPNERLENELKSTLCFFVEDLLIEEVEDGL